MSLQEHFNYGQLEERGGVTRPLIDWLVDDYNAGMKVADIVKPYEDQGLSTGKFNNKLFRMREAGDKRIRRESLVDRSVINLGGGYVAVPGKGGARPTILDADGFELP